MLIQLGSKFSPIGYTGHFPFALKIYWTPALQCKDIFMKEHSDTNLQNIFLSAAKIMVIALFKMTYVLYFEYYTIEMSGIKY